jgi:hypothetical protein
MAQQEDEDVIIYNSNELRNLYKRYWGASQHKFCIEHKLNKSKFSKWLAGKNNHKTIEASIIKWLSCNCDMKERITLEYSSLPDAISSVFTITSHHTNCNTIVFVDADNFDQVLAEPFVFPNPEMYDSFVICGLRKRAVNNRTLLFQNKYKHSSSVVASNTSDKDAIDTTLTIISAHLNAILPTEINFFFASNDRFVRETTSQLTAISGRKCIWYSQKKNKPNYTIDLGTLPTLCALRDKLASIGKPIPSHVLGEQFRLTNIEKTTLNATVWIQALNFPGVLEFLRASLKLHNTQTIYELIPRPID